MFVRQRRARRYILRILADGSVRVTLPRWGAKREAQAFVDANSAWISEQRALRRSRAVHPPALESGSTILIDGRSAVLQLDKVSGGQRLTCDGQLVAQQLAGSGQVRPAVEAWLRVRATRVLPAQLLQLAATHNIQVARVSVRDQRSRWGACSPSGTITLNWRLVQVPPFVREYVLVHELMHRLELNHSRRFWRLVVARCARHAEARAWLREEGRTLWLDRD